jgi:glycosyltransferase involved in cell wall biosynthesis
MRRLSPKLVPIPLLASHWVNPDIYHPYMGQPKEHDVIMLANFAPYKRHWLFFQMLRELPRRYKVVVMGVPLGQRTEAVLMAEARAFGVQDRFDLRMRLSDDAIAESLCRSRTSLIFSAQEGSCIAVAESLFANTPVGLFHNARIGSKAFLNPATGRLLEPGRVAAQIADFIETSALYQPRAWAMENISCEASHAILNQHLRDAAKRAGQPWTTDLLPFYQNALPRYVDPEQEQEMSHWYEDFAQRYGIRLGPPRLHESPVLENLGAA